jgi:hypothetical protein
LLTEPAFIRQGVIELYGPHVQLDHVVRELTDEGLGALAKNMQGPDGYAVFPNFASVENYGMFEVRVCAL